MLLRGWAMWGRAGGVLRTPTSTVLLRGIPHTPRTTYQHHRHTYRRAQFCSQVAALTLQTDTRMPLTRMLLREH